MAVKIYPIIRIEHYEEFKALISGLPKEHKDWIFQQDTENSNWLAASGDLARGIAVEPIPYQEWLREREGGAASIHSLKNYAGHLHSSNHT